MSFPSVVSKNGPSSVELLRRTLKVGVQVSTSWSCKTGESVADDSELLRQTSRLGWGHFLNREFKWTSPKCRLVLTTGAGNNLSKAVLSGLRLSEEQRSARRLPRGLAYPCSHHHFHPKAAFWTLLWTDPGLTLWRSIIIQYFAFWMPPNPIFTQQMDSWWNPQVEPISVPWEKPHLFKVKTAEYSPGILQTAPVYLVIVFPLGKHAGAGGLAARNPSCSILQLGEPLKSAVSNPYFTDDEI